MAEREPILIAAGDTVCWSRYLENWLPSAGWYILGEVRGIDQATAPAIEFRSTPDSTNTVHQIQLAAATTALWGPGESILVEYVVNDGLAVRHLLYQNNLRIEPNLGTAANSVDVRTEAQKMVADLYATLHALNKHALLETDIQKVRMLREKREAIRTELNYWETRRANELAVENAIAGRPSGTRIRPVFNFFSSGVIYGTGSGWPFTPPA